MAQTLNFFMMTVIMFVLVWTPVWLFVYVCVYLCGFVSRCQVSTTLCTVKRQAGRNQRWLHPAEERWWAASRAATRPRPRPWSCCSSRAISTTGNRLLWDTARFTMTQLPRATQLWLHQYVVSCSMMGKGPLIDVVTLCYNTCSQHLPENKKRTFFELVYGT